MGSTYAIYALQFITGLALLLGHGKDKFDVKGTMNWVKSQGYPALVGAWLAFAEIILAIALALGIFPRIAAAGIALTMLGAIHFHLKQKDGFKGGWEAAALYFIICVFLVFAGKGLLTPW